MRAFGPRICAAAAILGACSSAPFDRDVAERAVLAAVLEASVGGPSDSAHIVLSPLFEQYLPDRISEVLPKDVVADLRSALRADSVRLPLPTSIRVSLDTTAARRKHTADSLRREEMVRTGSGFEVVRLEYPGARAVYSLSHVGFSSNRRRAAVYLVAVCGWLCADGGVVELEFVDGRWRVLREELLWVS